MAKKIILSVVLVLILIPLIFLGWMGVRYLFDKDPDKSFFGPELKFGHLTIYEWNDREMKMNAELTILNRFPFSFQADSVAFRLYISDVEIVKNTKKISLNIKSSDSSTIFLPVVIKLNELQKLEKTAKLTGDSVPYRLESTFYSKALVWKKRKFIKERTFPLFHLLDIKIGRLKLNSLRRSDAEISLRLAIRNNNIFPVHIKKTEYELYIDGKFIGKGNIERQLDFNAQKTITLDFPMNISFKHLWETIRELLKERKKTPFNLKLSFNLLQDKNFEKSSRIKVDRKGTLDEVISDD